MFISALIAFAITYLIYKNWTITNPTWILLATKTMIIFAISMLIYIILATMFKIEFVGELIERIKNNIKRRIVR